MTKITLYCETGESFDIDENLLCLSKTLVSQKELSNSLKIEWEAKKFEIVGNAEEASSLFKLYEFIDYELLNENALAWIATAEHDENDASGEDFTIRDYLIDKKVNLTEEQIAFLKTKTHKTIFEMHRVADFLEMTIAFHFLNVFISLGIKDYPIDSWKQEFCNLIGIRCIVTDNPEEDAIRLEEEKANWNMMTTEPFMRYPYSEEEIKIGLVLNVKQDLTEEEKLFKFVYLNLNNPYFKLELKIYGRVIHY
jgi:hypothetical protein